MTFDFSKAGDLILKTDTASILLILINVDSLRCFPKMTKIPGKNRKVSPLYDVITSRDLNVILSTRENTTQFLNFCITLQPKTYI